jgi:acylphosphatase
MAAIRYIVRGRVQGVGFRDFARRAALAAGVRGWVRNRADGTVETVAAGESDALERFAADLRRGPRWSEVDSVEQENAAGEMPGPGFEIVR